MIDDILLCHHCRETLRQGDEYYDIGVILCPDCFDAWCNSILRTVGDVIDKTG